VGQTRTSGEIPKTKKTLKAPQRTPEPYKIYPKHPSIFPGQRGGNTKGYLKAGALVGKDWETLEADKKGGPKKGRSLKQDFGQPRKFPLWGAQNHHKKGPPLEGGSVGGRSPL